MEYRCEAKSVTGFVQQLVSCYLPHGYWFYVSGFIPPGKAAKAVDEKLMEKYEINVSRSTRARRKAAGLANLHYLRYEDRFLLLATHGHHPFFEEEASCIRDVRRVPIQFAGYSISVKPGGYIRKAAPDDPAVRDSKYRVHVQIAQKTYRELKDFFTEAAKQRSVCYLVGKLMRLPYEPYAPVRQQLLNILRLVNEIRHRAGKGRIDVKVLRYRRQIVRPFDTVLSDSEAESEDTFDGEECLPAENFMENQGDAC
jgi:hypothetical protein